MKFAWAILGLLLTSCAAKTRYVDVQVPTGRHQGDGGHFEITQVEDHRTLPSGGRLKRRSGETEVGPERAIGHQSPHRGQVGMTVLLIEGQTVLERARALLTEGLERRGHTMATGGIPIRLEVRQFWGTAVPQEHGVSLQIEILCELHLRGGKVVPVRGQVRYPCSSATEAFWQMAYRQAVDRFLADLDAELDAASY